MIVATLKDITSITSNVSETATEFDYTGSIGYVSGNVVLISYESDGTTPRTPHRTYECIVTGPVTTYPPDNPSDWSDLGANNRWKMFDGSPTSQTTNSTEILVEFDSSNTNALGVFNLNASSIEMTQIVNTELITDGDGSSDAFTKGIGWSFAAAAWSCDGTQTADTILYQDAGTNIEEDLWVIIVFTLSAYSAGNLYGYGGGTKGDAVTSNGTYTQIIQVGANTNIGVVGDSDFIGTVDDISVKFVPKYEFKNLTKLSVPDYYPYFFEPLNTMKKLIWYYPQYSNSSMRLSILGSTVDCGLVVVGSSFDLGLTEYNPTIGINDYSIKSTDAFGNTILSQGDFADRIDLNTLINDNDIDGVKDALTNIRGTPALWDCNNVDLGFNIESTIIYGFFEKFDILIPMGDKSQCNIRIQGLT